MGRCPSTVGVHTVRWRNENLSRSTARLDGDRLRRRPARANVQDSGEQGSRTVGGAAEDDARQQEWGSSGDVPGVSGPWKAYPLLFMLRVKLHLCLFGSSYTKVCLDEPI